MLNYDFDDDEPTRPVNTEKWVRSQLAQRFWNEEALALEIEIARLTLHPRG